MKRIINHSAIAAIALLALACNKNEELVKNTIENNPVSEAIPFTIYASASKTKAVNDGLDTRWSDGDQINVFHAVAGSNSYVNDGAFTLANAATGEFNGHLASALTADTDYDWYMIYPYNSNLTTPATASTQGSKKYDYYTIGGRSQTQSGNNSMSHLAGSIVPFAGKVTNVPDDETPSLTLVPLTSVIAINVTNNSGAEMVVSDISFTATESVVGTYFVNFAGASPVYTPSESYYVYTEAPLTVTSGTLANNASAKYYIAIKPFTASSGTLKISVNGLEKEKIISTTTNFVAGSIKTLNFNYDEVLAAPISTATDVTVGFESSEGFKAGSTYNNQTVNYDGTNQWGILSGTVSTNSKITGSNSLQMRWYASNSSTVPYAFTKFRLSSVSKVTFKAKSSDSGLGVKVYYSTDNRASWTEANEYELTSTADTYTVVFPVAKENVSFKFEAVLPASLPNSGNLPLIIDDIVFSNKTVDPRVTVETSTASAITADGATMRGTISLIDGASLANVTDAGFYYKLTSAGDEAYVKYPLASLPPACTSISKAIDGLEPVSYTYYAYAVYSGKGEVTGSTQTFTPTTPPATKTYTLTIDSSTLDKLTDVSGYAAYNGDHTITATASDDSEFAVTINSNQVMSNNTNNQWQKNKGVIYNKTDLGKIKSVTVNSTSGTFTTKYGTTENPSNASLGDNDGFFKVSVGNATGYTESIVVTFEK